MNYYRFNLANQSDWGSKRGFYLNFENESTPHSPCSLENLRLILGVADGNNWRFLVVKPPNWQFQTDYSVKAIIAPTYAEVYLNDQLVQRSEGGFLPLQGELLVNHIPAWANYPTDYLVLQTSLKLSQGKARLSLSFKEKPLPLFLFEPQNPQRILNWRTKEGENIIIEASFRLLPFPNLRDLAPLVDRYGQCRYANWKGKVKSDEDLANSLKEERTMLDKMEMPKGFDEYGGYELAGWKEEPTGFFRLVQRNGFWWLISPKGNPCFYTGVCGVPALTWEMTPVTEREFLYEYLPPKEPPYSACWGRDVWGEGRGTEYLALHTINLIRKYGEDWRNKALEITKERLKRWAFSGVGKWGGMEGFPNLPVLRRWDVPNLVRHPDIFDPQIQERFRESLRRQIESQKDSPWVVGWSLGNEYDEIITKGEIREILNKSQEVAGKRALVDFALEDIYRGDVSQMAGAWKVKAKSKEDLYSLPPNPPEEDVEKLRQFYAERYYSFVYKTVKDIDPNHLFFGWWIVPGWWENEADWYLQAKYCDVIGYDRYTHDFVDPWFSQLVNNAKKPIICGEFSFPPFYDGERGFGVYHIWVKDDREAGRSYERWIRDATSNPYCVGVAWFFYRDQSITGRGPGRGSNLVYGEHYAFGLVDVTDRPKWDLVRYMREANLNAPRWRMEAMRKSSSSQRR